MSRSQQSQVIKEAQGQNAQEYQNSQNSYTKAQKDITNYEDQLANYSATDPYQEGGEYETAENQVIGNSADSAARAGENAIQEQTLRTGENSAGANATAEEIADQSERSSAAQQAEAQTARIGSEAGYKTNVLQGNQFPVQAETALSGQQGSQAGQALSVQNSASATPGFWDTFGDAFAKAAGNTLGGGNNSSGGGGGGGGGAPPAAASPDYSGEGFSGGQGMDEDVAEALI